MKPTNRVLLLTVLAITFLGFGGNLSAVPTHEYDWTYWNGCGYNVTEAGDYTIFCTAIHTSHGTQDGDWMAYTAVSCDTFEVEQNYYYKKCNGQWVLVSSSDFLSCSYTCP